jgi:hypothetical protein
MTLAASGEIRNPDFEQSVEVRVQSIESLDKG